MRVRTKKALPAPCAKQCNEYCTVCKGFYLWNTALIGPE